MYDIEVEEDFRYAYVTFRLFRSVETQALPEVWTGYNFARWSNRNPIAQWRIFASKGINAIQCTDLLRH